jgi:predicted DNA-binding antitoxin AbrB/MazE fold protein
MIRFDHLDIFQRRVVKLLQKVDLDPGIKLANIASICNKALYLRDTFPEHTHKSLSYSQEFHS